jgi:LPPG:FO 2-phospho-L-lactate transferase
VPKLTCLAGGVGAARFLQGLQKTVTPSDVTVIINTGDDIQLHGLHISPDIDIVEYTLAGIVNPETGWGISGDSFTCLKALSKLGHESWFNLGDADLATHISRTKYLKEGYQLSEITRRHAKQMGVEEQLLPMTDDPVATYIQTDEGLIHFEEYLVKRGALDVVLGVRYVGVETAKPAPGVIDAIESADGVIVCPSNPVVSIGTILSVPGIRQALQTTRAKVSAISPIVRGAPIKGPADKIMSGMGLEVSCVSVAKLYEDFVDTFIIDDTDYQNLGEIEKLGMKAYSCNTIMKTPEIKTQLAKKTLNSIGLV